MPAKIPAEEIRRQLSRVSTTPMGGLKIIIEEQYTPRDYLAQRYQVSLVAMRNNTRHHVATEGELINPVIVVKQWMSACGLTTDDLIFKIK